MNEEIDIRERAVRLTIEYFKDRQVKEDDFMRKLEKIYDWLIDGKPNKEFLTKQ